MADLGELRSQATQGVEDVSKLQQDIPGLLAGLKQNLTSIYSKDNPLIQKRESLLSDYLSSPERTSASLLPANLPMVAGSNLNLSPTQQSAIRASRESAAFAPLASLNNLIVGQYGNVGDIFQGAAQGYQTQLEAAKTRQAGLMDLYKAAIDEERTRQSSGVDIEAILDAYLRRQQSQETSGPNIDAFLDSLVEKDYSDLLTPENILRNQQNRPALPAPSLDLSNRQPTGSGTLRFNL